MQWEPQQRQFSYGLPVLCNASAAVQSTHKLHTHAKAMIRYLLRQLKCWFEPSSLNLFIAWFNELLRICLRDDLKG